jgi:SAM-dependent methyltransferase
MTKLLNLGCGARFNTSADWTNVDFQSGHERVIAHDLLRRFPFPDDVFDGVYHSHVLEHFTPADGRRFIGECRRVLKPGCVLRVAVPDGAQICRLYLEALGKLEKGAAEWQGRYDWILLELYDQAVRTTPGGEMANYLSRPDLPDKDFIIARIGNIGREIIESATNVAADPASPAPPVRQRWMGLLKNAPRRLRERFKLALLSERERQALALGLFRLSGEVHQWIYDDYSMRRLFESAGFGNVRCCSATESWIEGWRGYFLDVDPDGAEHAPSSLYLEGRK